MTLAAETLGNEPKPRGINVVGHLRSPSGLGHTARLFIEVLQRKGFQVAGYDIEAYAATEPSPLSEGMLKGSIDELPYEHNLLISSIDRLPQLWLRHAKQLLEPRFRNAGLIFWELSTIPAAWLPSLRMFDVIATCSHYVRQALETAVPEVPTVFVEHPLKRTVEGVDRTAVRSRFGIPLDRTAYCCSLDLSSLMARKNPLASIQAWTRAFPAETDVCLVVKLNGNTLKKTSYNRDVDQLIEQVKNDSRIVFINERLSDEDLMALYHCCDVFVSLHRSEGLGLIPMEAMSLGKAVVATGYSGNMTFMTEQNSFPVNYRLVAPANDASFVFSRRFAGPSASWADPDVDHAVDMLRAAREPATANAVGEQAREDIARRQESAWRGSGLDQMAKLLTESDRSRLRSTLKWQVLLQEILDPDLRRKNLEKTFRRAAGKF